ncbi:LamB/YcsF family protein [Nocardia sp. NPDC059246]|uniref:LamB/YcsF family protein n=1 Tax=unclassified Nocardia TaxID=2637762 RepID=UPI0036A592CB
MTIDLNADLGEGFGRWTAGDDLGLLDLVTSANVACGFHAGDPSIMRRVCGHAAVRNVVIGAHVGYRDLVGFGRRDIDVSASDVGNETVYQIAALDGLARAEGTRVRYLKPHGALYHRSAHADEIAAALVQAVCDYNPDLEILGPPNSALARHSAAEGLRFRAEGFADRGYNPDGSLAERSQPGAVTSVPEDAAAQALSIAVHRTVRTVTGSLINLDVDSLCVHGDSAHALETARQVRATLADVGVVVEAFV